MNKNKFQKFTDGKVYPVHNNKFFVKATDDTDASTIIRGLESFSPAINGALQTWTTMDSEGFESNMVTGKGLTISLSGKRVYGDAGNDFIASSMLGTGSAVETAFKWEMPSGATLEGDCVINLKTPGGGDSTNIDALEFDIIASGKPTYTAATS